MRMEAPLPLGGVPPSSDPADPLPDLSPRAGRHPRCGWRRRGCALKGAHGGWQLGCMIVNDAVVHLLEPYELAVVLVQKEEIIRGLIGKGD